MKLGSKDNSERRKAKNSLKRKYLEEFTSRMNYEKDELKNLVKAIKTINARFLGSDKAL